MRQKRSGKVFLAAALVLAVFFAWQGSGKGSSREDEKVFPAEAWIMALEQKDTGAIKAELNARDEAQRQQAARTREQALARIREQVRHRTVSREMTL